MQVVTPDVIVKKAADGGWKIELNAETLPKVLVNRVYHSEVSKLKCREQDTLFVSEQFANANWLVKSLDQRARTNILEGASEIVRQHDAFLVFGGTSAGYNHGFAVADEHSEYLIKLNSDIQVLTVGWLAEVIDFLSAHKQVGFVALNQVNHPMLRLVPRLQVGGREVMQFAQ